MGERFFFRFQILLSHNNNHLTAPCGLGAANDVERERRGGGGERLMQLDNDQGPLDSDQSCTLQRNTLMDLPSLPALPYLSHSVAAHTPMHSISLYLGLTLAKSYLIYLATF